jgi:hypothetical protein
MYFTGRLGDEEMEKMKHRAAEAAFKPKRSRIESRQDATSRAAWAIIATASAAIDAKTARLRAERLASEAMILPVEAKPGRRRRPNGSSRAGTTSRR